MPTLKQFKKPYFIETAPDGAITAACPDLSESSRAALPLSWDLAIHRNAVRPMIICWTPGPANDPERGCLQFTGVRIYAEVPSTVLPSTVLPSTVLPSTLPLKKPADLAEQINNVLKHSAAKNLIIELILEECENRIGLTITDDGKGFHPDKVKKSPCTIIFKTILYE